MSKRDFFRTLGKWFRKISPPVPVGGMQITDFAVRYASVEGDRLARESLRLQPGVVDDGKVKSKAALMAALRELRRRVNPDSRKSVSVVLSLSVRDVYIQTFGTPQIGETDFKEAADLNARMISPINVENAYYGWQRVSKGFTASTNVDMLGAFIQKPVVDEFVEAVESAGFSIAAIEFESMSLARIVNRLKLIGEGKPYIIVLVAAEGTSMIVVRKGLPHFHYFHPWSEVQDGDKSVSVDKFKSALVDELERVINFYFTHWSGEKLDDVIFITPFFEEEITSLIKEKFASLKTQIVDPVRLNVVTGAAWRGVVPRSSDAEISLASLSALGVFERQQRKNFVRVWRNIFTTSLGFLLMLFVSINIFLRTRITKILESQGSVLSDPNVEEFVSLSEDAKEFNELVAMIAGVKANGVEPSKFLIEIGEIAGDSVGITKLSFDPSDSVVVVNGTAPDENAAVAFKNRIAEKPQFRDVNLPLQNIVSAENRVSFSLDFKVSSFDFTE